MRKRFPPILLCFVLAACAVLQNSLSASPPPSAFTTVQTLAPVASSINPSSETTSTPFAPPSLSGGKLTNLTHILWPEPIANQPLEEGRTVKFSSLHLQDATAGWGLEIAGHIVRTTDGGTTWQDVTPPNGIYNATTFFDLDANHAWAVDDVQIACGPTGLSWCPGAMIWRTSDGGGT